MALGQLNMAGMDMVQVAVARLKEFEPPEGYYLAFSGGKDSVVIYNLAVEAGVKFDAHYAQGGIDPPELVQFIRRNYPTVTTHRPPISVWKGIQLHGMPRRQGRWCCELIKESGGGGRRVVTGIRWQESSRRAKRRLVEACYADKSKLYVNPIIDWHMQDVWEYIKTRGLPYCSLYDEGFKRLGCVLCPMTSAAQAKRDAARWPKLADAWHRACVRYYENRQATKPEVVARWPTADDFWHWWLSRKGEPKVHESQCVMFDN